MFAHYIWIAPLAVCVVAFFCWQEVGLAVLPGVFLFLCLVPFQWWIGRFFVRLRYCLTSVTIWNYSLTSPYGHFYNRDTSLIRTVRLVPEMPKTIHSLPLQYGHLCKADSWFCPFGVLIKEVWLYNITVNNLQGKSRKSVCDSLKVFSMLWWWSNFSVVLQ